MDLKEAIYTRRAVGEFTVEEVDDKTIRELLDAAIQAPSAVNQQAWSFTVVRDKTLLARISREAKSYMLKTLLPGPMAHHFQQLWSDPDFDIFYRAPVLILISSTAENPRAVEDCSLAAENLMLAARGAGLGTCWIGFAQKWLGTPEGKAALNLPQHVCQLRRLLSAIRNPRLRLFRERSRKYIGCDRKRPAWPDV